MRNHFAAVPQPDDGEVVFGADFGFTHGLADQPGFGRQDDFRRANLLSKVDEVVAGPAEWKRLEFQGIPQRVGPLVRGVDIGEQDIASLQFRPCGRAEHLGRKPCPAFDGEKVHARGTERQFVKAFSDERRIGTYARALFAFGEAVSLDPLQEAWTTVRRSQCACIAAQQVAREKHIDDAECEQRQSERGKTEKAEPLCTLADQFGVYDQVGRRGHQRQHSANQRGEAQGHHEPACSRAAALRDAQYHRDKDGHHSG